MLIITSITPDFSKPLHTFAALAALLIVLEENGRYKRLQIHHVLVEVTSVLVLPDAALQIILSWFSRREDIDARTVFCHTNQQIMRMPRQHLCTEEVVVVLTVVPSWTVLS